MLLRSLYMLGTTVALGLVWFFAVYAFAEQAFAVELTDGLLAFVLGLCLFAGALVGCRLFLKPRCAVVELAPPSHHRTRTRSD